MFSIKLETRLTMVEFRRVPSNQLEIPAMMFFMTRCTLELFRKGVITQSLLDSGPDLDVALQAIIPK